MTYRRAQKLAAAALICVALGGCALLGGSKPPPAIFDLLTPDKFSVGQRLSVQIIVTTPSAVRAIETDRIMVKTASAQLAYFPGAVWSDKLPRLVQARLVHAMQNSGRFRAAGDESDKIDGDVLVLSNIRAFHMEIGEGFATARIEIYVKLVDDDSQRTVSSKEFTAFAEAAGNSTEAGVEALNRAFHKITPQIVKWIGRARIHAKAG